MGLRDGGGVNVRVLDQAFGFCDGVEIAARRLDGER
jgi:hypothetical protein